MSGTSKKKAAGFSLIEIMVVILIIGGMAALFVPTFFRRSSESATQTFVTDLNALMQVGVLEAMRTGLLHRVKFDLEKSHVMLEAAQHADVDPQSISAPFVPVFSAAAQTVIPLPDALDIRKFFIGKTDELAGGLKNKKVWLFIGPDGSVQDVTMVIADTENEQTVSLMTNPFSGQLVMYEGVQKP